MGQFPWYGGKDIAFTPAGEKQTQIPMLDSEIEAGADTTLPTDDASDTGEETGFTDEEVDQILNGTYAPPGLVAASNIEHTDAMIALLPTIPDQERLAVPGGEDEEELHLTLFYLGDAAKITPEVRDRIVVMMSSLAKKTPIIDGDGFAISTFNPEKPDKETCVTLGVSGPELARVHKHVVADLADGIDMVQWPDQHVPWIPHITLAYSNDSSLPTQLTDRTGPIRFDVLRVAFAGQVTDFPLYDGTRTTEEVRPVSEDVGMIAAGGKESDVNKKGGSHNLRDYWVHGEGAAKIAWGTDGSFARCVAQLGKHVKNPQGLCAEYHKAATGEWPAEKGVESSVEIAVTAGATVDLGEYDGGWEGVLMVEDSDTGDGRMFSGGAVTWGDTTEQIHPLQWAPANNGEHKGSVTAGRITKIWRDPANPRVVMGKGTFNLNDEDGARAFTQVKDGYAGGISIDPDQIADADVELEFDTAPMNPLEAMQQKPTKTIFHAGRIRGATLVAFPALVEAAIKLTKKSDNTSALVAASNAPWKAVQHEQHFIGDIDGLVASLAFGYVRDLDDVVERQQCRFLHHEMNDDGSVGLPNLVACAQHITAINTGRTFGLSHDELFSAYQHMAEHFTEAGIDAPVFAVEGASEGIVASVQAPPLEWFGKPDLSAPTPITVTDDGRVFGHAAAWNSCHTGFADTCVSPPFENDYSYFTTGEVLTAEGHRVAVGQITLGTSHAPTRGLSVAKAIDHYGDTGTAVADVSAGVDDYGIWVAGAVRPGTTAEQLHALRASALSGDWRRIGGQLRMVALLAVNVPGFPLPRVSAAVNSGKQVSLVASGIVAHNDEQSFAAEIALLASACDIPLGKEEKKYASTSAELAALHAQVFDTVDEHGNKHDGSTGRFKGFIGKLKGGSDGDDDHAKRMRGLYDNELGAISRNGSGPEKKAAKAEIARREKGGKQELPSTTSAKGPARADDADDGPSRAENEKRLNELEDKLEGDEGLNDTELKELDKLRKIIYER